MKYKVSIMPIELENEQRQNIELSINNVYQLKILTNMTLTRAKAWVDRLVTSNHL